MDCGLRIADCGFDGRAVGRRVELYRGASALPPSPFLLPQGLNQVRQIDFEIGEQGRLGARSRRLVEVDVVGQHRLLEQRPAQYDLAAGVYEHRGTGEALAALE